ncbi:hypothetical protein [Trichothermofontia sp.]
MPTWALGATRSRGRYVTIVHVVETLLGLTAIAKAGKATQAADRFATPQAHR